MPPESTDDGAVQAALAAYIRDPAHAPPPVGIESRRLAVYRELFFNNVESLLAGNFPVIQQILAGDRWLALVRGFYRDHGARTPLFTELPREFLRYLETRAATTPDGSDATDPPWLAPLAHYEWVELALQISELREEEIARDPEGDLLEGRPLVSPLAWPLEYAWPVHLIGPGNLPDAATGTPTWLLLQRDASGTVRFQLLSALTYRLLQRLDEFPALDGRAQLQALASEAQAPSVARFVEDGAAMLRQLRSEGVLCGTRSD